MATNPQSSAQEKIKNKVTPTITQIPFSIVDRPANKTTRLLANAAGSAPIDGQNRWHSFDFNRSIFVYRIVVNETNYPEYGKFEIEVTSDDGEVIKSNVAPSGSKVILTVNNFCKSIRFRPPKSYSFQNKTIDSVEIFGFDKSEVGKFLQFARDIDALKSNSISQIDQREVVYKSKIEEAEKADVRANDARKEVDSLKNQADRQKNNIRRLESERSDLTIKIGILEDTLRNNNRLLEEIRAELDTKTKVKKTIEDQVSSLGSKLTELRANLDLFPSELESFVTQGRKNMMTLFWLAVAPIVVIVMMFGILISGAVDLTTKIDPEGKINIAALVASRTPYVAVALAIITACYKIARVFILELIEINRQRLNLTKVSIIAKDVSAASETGLELTDVERYGLRVRLKMELLKDHLKGYISPNLQISLPSRITDYLPFSNILEKRSQLREGTDNENGSLNDGESQSRD